MKQRHFVLYTPYPFLPSYQSAPILTITTRFPPLSINNCNQLSFNDTTNGPKEIPLFITLEIRKTTFYYFKSIGSSFLLVMWCPTEPTVKEEEDPFSFTFMSHALGAINCNIYSAESQQMKNLQRITAVLKRIKVCSPTAIKTQW